MILFGLYTGQRLGEIATLRWNNLDVARGELRLSTRKTGKAIVLPLAHIGRPVGAGEGGGSFARDLKVLVRRIRSSGVGAQD
jgi:integrase